MSFLLKIDIHQKQAAPLFKTAYEEPLWSIFHYSFYTLSGVLRDI
jgi:hypothetical protein